jgi:hypothetical protein
MRLLFLALTLSSSAVLAQTTQSAFQLSLAQGGTTLTVGPAECALPRQINWTLTSGVAVCSELKVWITTATSCEDTIPATGALLVQEVSQGNLGTTRSGTPTFTVSDLPRFKEANAAACGAEQRRDTYRLCGSVRQSSGFGGCETSPLKASPSVSVVYDAQPPAAPGLEVSGLDQALNVRVNASGDDLSELRVEVRREAGAVPVASVRQTAEDPQFRVPDLENGVTYLVTGYAIDEAGNESVASEQQSGTPQLTLGFFDNYTKAGGAETGGCAATGGGLVGGALLAAVAFWLSSRRNRS